MTHRVKTRQRKAMDGKRKARREPGLMTDIIFRQLA